MMKVAYTGWTWINNRDPKRQSACLKILSVSASS